MKGVTLKKAGYYKLEVWGAQGGYTDTVMGFGGYSVGTYSASIGSVIYIAVGQRSIVKTSSGASGCNQSSLNQTERAYNGGGEGSFCTSYGEHVASGGGATHISTYNCGELKYCESYKGTYNSSKDTYDGGRILIVAGGGGGSGKHTNTDLTPGGNGGGYRGGAGTPYSSYSAMGGGTQTAGGAGGGSNANSVSGSFGLGGGGAGSGGHMGSGGGGGWFGGAGNGSVHSGGGGGSGYIGNSLLLTAKGVTKQMYMYSTGCTSSSAAATKTTCTSSTGAHIANRANTGNGYAKITYLGT